MRWGWEGRMARMAGNDGYITLAVLVMAGLLAGLVSALLMVSRPALGLARIGADQIAADALLDGGLQAAGYLLFAAERDYSSVNGMTLRFRSGSVRLAVADEGGRVDLNASDPQLLSGLFAAIAGASMSPSAFAARIADWRDEEAEASEGGAEAEAYEEAGLSYRPANGPFRSVEELRLLLGLSAADYRRLAPYVTVYNPLGTVDAYSAPPTVLRAVPDMDRQAIERLLAGRRGGVRNAEALFDLAGIGGDFLSSEPSGVYRIGIEARLQSGFTEMAEAVVIAPPDEMADFGVVAWTRLAAGTALR